MNWDPVAEQHKKKYERNYVSCHEPHEKRFVIDLIIKHFPDLRKSKVEQAINQACKTISTPCERNVFLKCVEECLGDNAKQLTRARSESA